MVAVTLENVTLPVSSRQVWGVALRGVLNAVMHHIWVVALWEVLRYHTGAVEEGGVEGGKGVREESDLVGVPQFLRHLVPMRAREPSIPPHLVQPVEVIHMMSVCGREGGRE